MGMGWDRLDLFPWLSQDARLITLTDCMGEEEETMIER